MIINRESLRLTATKQEDKGLIQMLVLDFSPRQQILERETIMKSYYSDKCIGNILEPQTKCTITSAM